MFPTICKRTVFILLVLLLAGCAPSTPAATPPAATESHTDQPAPTAAATEQPAVSPTPTAAVSEPADYDGFLLADAGLATPESVIHDTETDVYLVSNINGSPSSADGNGFISRVTPAGEMLDLTWIDGEASGVTLNAPKGMGLTDTELWVTDITVLRVFDRETGAPLEDVPIAGASFLNDIAVAPDGAVWVTDSSTGALHRVAPDRSVEQVATVPGINGVAFFNETPWVTGDAGIVSVAPDGTTSEQAAAPDSGLDGLVILRNGALVVSSWGGSAVYTIGMNEVRELVGGISGPADIGFDERRFYVLIPHFNDDALQAVPLP